MNVVDHPDARCLDSTIFASSPGSAERVEQSKIVGGSTIAGYVIGPDGKRIAGASVMFASSPVALPDIAQLTDAQGAFALAAPASGSYRLVINAPGFPLAERSVDVTDQATLSIEVKVGESL